MNFLEQLAAEWYEYNGCFVRRNSRARKRQQGGWDVELDVLALNPHTGELIHLEASGDASSWEQRKVRFLNKKFVLRQDDYERIVGGAARSIRKVALVGWTKSTSADLNWGDGIEVKLIPSFFQEIIASLRERPFIRDAVPEERFPLLRAIQLALTYNPQ